MEEFSIALNFILAIALLFAVMVACCAIDLAKIEAKMNSKLIKRLEVYENGKENEK